MLAATSRPHRSLLESTQKLKNQVCAVCPRVTEHARHEKNHRLLKSAFREKGGSACREHVRARVPACDFPASRNNVDLQKQRILGKIVVVFLSMYEWDSVLESATVLLYPPKFRQTHSCWFLKRKYGPWFASRMYYVCPETTLSMYIGLHD